MEQVVAAPPPLPPKTRRSPPASATVLNNTAADVFSYRFPEVHGHSEVSTSTTGNHVVKIRINPQETLKEEPVVCEVSPCIRISVNTDNEMVQRGPEGSSTNPYFFFNTVMSSGQVSPSDTLDSGTCSDLDSTPPPLPKKKNAVSVTLIGLHKRAPSLSSGAEVDSDDNESNISCDSLNSGESTEAPPQAPSPQVSKNKTCLPQGLLQDIRDHSKKEPERITEPEPVQAKTIVDESTYEDRKKLKEEQETANLINSLTFDTDRFYNFHLNEHENEEDVVQVKKYNEDETFAGYKDFFGGDGASTIRSAKGTVRGVKNRVRAGIATFLQINSTTKSYKEKDAGKVVVYTTTMGIVRETYYKCVLVKQILRTLLVKFEERDVFMSREFQDEIRDRMRCDHVLVPQVFVDGQHIGDAETVERLNETGELRRILKSYKSMGACTTCKVCGGYRLLPCPVCSGSKKSVHRNHFTAEFVALKCMNCDEVGLVRCTSC